MVSAHGQMGGGVGSGVITWKGEAWDMLWLCLVPVIFAVLAGLFFCMKRFAPRLVPLLGAYGK